MIDAEKPRGLPLGRVDPPRPSVPRLLPAVPTIRDGTIETSARKPDGAAPPAPQSALAVWIATAGGLGYAPFAPGTFGSLGGVALFLALARLHPALFVLSVTALGFLGVWASDAAERHFDRSDDGRIVIDEVVGQLIALAPLVVLAPSEAWIVPVVTGFVLFRVLDIWKPGPVRWAERRFEGGVGVMADDVVAGGLGACGLAGLLTVASGLAGASA